MLVASSLRAGHNLRRVVVIITIAAAPSPPQVKIWDVFNTQKCMRTYLGHSKGVREVQFSNDGTRFLSCG